MFQFKNKTLVQLAIAASVALATQNASALVVTTYGNATATKNNLVSTLVGAGSGISVIGNSSTYQGIATQAGTYTGFNLVPNTAAKPTLSMGNGIVMTTGRADMPQSNTGTAYSNALSGSTDNNAMLANLAGAQVYDANALGFNFTVANGVTSVSAQFVFGSEEFPSQNVTDIFGFFVDGVNYAKFPNGGMIANTAGGKSSFISNAAGNYGIEYNGLTNVYTVTALLNTALSTHTFLVGVGDTYDDMWDSGVFLSGMKAGASNIGGISASDVPEPGSLALLGLGLAGLAMRGRKKAAL